MDPVRFVERVLAALLRRVQDLSRTSGPPDSRRVRESQEFWNDPANSDLETLMHWRGQGPFQDDELWLSLGRRHLEMLKRAAEWVDIEFPVAGIVEWGCGGGLNAVHLAPQASVYYGVDVNEKSLDECVRQVDAGGAGTCIPVLIDTDSPESVFAQIKAPSDLVFSSYVFEVFPSCEYGLRILRIAFELLRPGGVALIQVRYHSGVHAVGGVRGSYVRNWLTNTSYTIDGFWQASQEIGFEPLYVTLIPVQPELDESRYAYFALRK